MGKLKWNKPPSLGERYQLMLDLMVKKEKRVNSEKKAAEKEKSK